MIVTVKIEMTGGEDIILDPHIWTTELRESYIIAPNDRVLSVEVEQDPK